MEGKPSNWYGKLFMVGTSGRWCAAVDSLPCPRGEGVVYDDPDVDTRVSGKVGYTVGGCRLYEVAVRRITCIRSGCYRR